MSTKTLWAPWRMEYLVSSEKEKDQAKKKGKKRDCVFCELEKENSDKKNLIVYRTETVFVILNKFPYNNGHVMVMPKGHASSIVDLKDDVHTEIARITKLTVRALQLAYKPDGFNIGMNIGAAAGAGIPEHVHMHVIPRWIGDTNFLPIMSETKSLPEHLSASFDRIVKHFSKVESL